MGETLDPTRGIHIFSDSPILHPLFFRRTSSPKALFRLPGACVFLIMVPGVCKTQPNDKGLCG